MLAWRMFWREWRSGEMNLLIAALVLGVTIVTGISLFAERLQGALVGEANSYLGADKALQASELIDNTWLEQAKKNNIRTARTAVFPTMIYAGDAMVLSSLKAVSINYPLRGDLEVKQLDGTRISVNHGPLNDAAWVDENILTQLNIAIGDVIEIGDKKFRVEHVLTKESDAKSSVYSMGPRVMISDAVLMDTHLLMPGSRVEYRYLFSGDQTSLKLLFDELEGALQKGQRILTLKDNQPGIAGALEKAELFLRLAGALGVLLSALAGAFSAQRYCNHHVDVVASMKTLGAGRKKILSLLLLQMGLLWVFSTAAGFALGGFLQAAFLFVMADWIPAQLPDVSLYPFALGAATSFICMLAFVFPSFWRLQAIPPWQVLRGDKMEFSLHWSDMLWVVAGITMLLLLYSQNVRLVAYLLAGLLLLVSLTASIAWVMMRGTQSISMQASGFVRLGISNVKRRGAYSMLQVVVFAIGFMLLSIMVLLRTSLLTEWQMQLPQNAPNTFLINIAPDQKETLENRLNDIGVVSAGMYPMVKGRLTKINGVEATALFDESVSEVYRELNLSWSQQMPADNTLAGGSWFTAVDDNTLQVSIEKSLAKRLNVWIGDKLTFNMGGVEREVTVSSVRNLDWGKMSPNFYFLFPSGTLESFNATYITSFYVPTDAKAKIIPVLRHFPTVTAYPVDDLINRIRSIVKRAGLAVEIIMVLVLVAGILVLMACLRASLDQRLHESALLRTLGAGKQLVLGSLAIEFLILGVSAGLLAVLGTELCVWSLQTRIFKMAYVPHPELWFIVPTAAATLMTLVGTAFCFRAVSVPPMIVLRDSHA
jgi:putative ABC transport system permease protein